MQPRTAALTRRHSFHHGQRPNLSTLDRARAATMSALPLMRKSDEEISSDLRRVSEEKDEEVSTPAPSAAGALVVAGLFFLVVASGMATNVAFELLSREEPGCAGVLTLAQYLMALASSAPRAVAHLRRPSVPLRWHGAFTALMLLTAYCGNKSVDWKVPFPLYLIIKSSNLVANRLVGRLGFAKIYGLGQVAGVLLMTAGVVLATLVARRGGDDAEEVGGAQVAVGAALCALSTFTMAALGCLQERAFEVHGNNSEEAAQEVLFYIHFLGIVPLLALQGTAPLERAHRWVIAPGAALALPSALQSFAPPRLWCSSGARAHSDDMRFFRGKSSEHRHQPRTATEWKKAKRPHRQQEQGKPRTRCDGYINDGYGGRHKNSDQVIGEPPPLAASLCITRPLPRGPSRRALSADETNGREL